MRLSLTHWRGCLVGAPTCIRARAVSSKHNVGVDSAGRSGWTGPPWLPCSGSIWPSCARRAGQGRPGW